ncbi:cutinase family protein [Nocardia noduli]|uniref:cutinase family protein n=1 Tax=Nocardia noduli TaxID=2815722 RepID=UPI001C24008E|nr:cutinase family protein [Nocardia noduli]
MSILRRAQILGVVTAGIVAALCGSGPALAAPAPTQPGVASADTGCPAVAGIFMPGTWETDESADPSRPRGLLAPVATSLEQQFGSQFEAVFPAYAARAMDGMLYGDSQAQGLSAAKAAVTEIAARCKSTKFLLSGYSQGADVAGDLASAIGCRSDPIPAQRVLAVGLVADPKQGTSGGKLVGPTVSGTGIRGTRTEGFCALSAVTAQLCETGDKYCATDAATNPILAGLGKVLSQPGTSTSPTNSGRVGSTGSGPTGSTPDSSAGSSQLTRSLDAGFSGEDLTTLPARIETLTAQMRTGGGATGDLAETADSVATLLARLGDLGEWSGANPSVQQQLSTGDAGSAQQAAAKVLTAVQGMDLDAALSALSTITGRLAAGTSAAGSDSGLGGALDALVSATAGLTGTGTDALGQAGKVLSLLKPSTLISQVTTVASNTIDFAATVPQILDTVRRIGTAVTDPSTDLGGKVRAVHQVFADLNQLCQPLVRMAAGIDLSMVSGLLGLIPDPHGIAQTASLVLGVLDNLDVIGLARQVGALQENLWGILEAITGGGDLLALGARFAELGQTLLGFAGLAFDTLTGNATKTSPQLLDTAINTTGASDLTGITAALTSSETAQDADALAQLVSEGIDAATFYTSGAHQSYDSYVVDDAGRTALVWLADWFANRIRQVGA